MKPSGCVHIAVVLASLASQLLLAAPIAEPLQVHPTNPRYFTDDGARASLLTGSHTWPNLIDRGPSDPPPAFDFSAYLELLQKHHHNFIRLWSRHVGWYHDYGEWIAPHTDAWGGARNVPASGSTKVSFLDSDHWFVKEIYWDPALGRDWVWRAFGRGYNPILMEHLSPVSFLDGDYPLTNDDRGYIASRRAMGQTRRIAERMNLAAMTPRGELASSGYCLANPGKEYLVFVPGGGDVTVDLTTVSGTLAVEWLRLAEEVVTQGAPVPGGGKRRLRAPFAGDAAIHLKTESPQPERKTKR